MKRLLEVREEIIGNMRSAERPSGLQSELLDEVYRIDSALARTALFTVEREAYQAPPVHQTSQPELAIDQQETLF